MRTAFEWLTDYLEICGSVNVGKLWQCPAHDDSYPSLSLSEDEPSGRVLVHCFGGCDWEEVLASLHLKPVSLFQPHLWSPQKYYDQVVDKPVFEDFHWKQSAGNYKGDYWYKHGDSGYKSEHFHYFSPSVRQRRLRLHNGKKQIYWQYLDGWTWKTSRGDIDFAKLPLYCSDAISSAKINGELIVLCESESSVDALVKAGVTATTWAGGASSPQLKTLAVELEDCHVLYIADNDIAGLKCAGLIEEALSTLVASWSVLVGQPGEDARDLLARGALDSVLNH